MNYEQWNKHTTDLQNKHGYTGKPKKGQLAQVSLYEFINDWLRPELQWKIMSYAVEENPHKSLLKQVQEGYMPQFIPKNRCSAMNVGSWDGNRLTRHLITPSFYHSKMDDTSNYFRGEKGKWYMPMNIQGSEDWDIEDTENTQDVITRKNLHRLVMNDRYKRGYTWENRLVHNLKALRESDGNGRQRWTVSKKELLEHLKENNVKGRVKMAAASPPPGQFVYGVRRSNNRNDAITALMKL